VLPALASLIALQKLDTAAETARQRLAELPAAEAALARQIEQAAADVETARARLAGNQEARRALEKDVAGVDTRLARFDSHKSAVKTNQEFTALLHEIEVAKKEKDEIEERILMLMEEGDTLGAAVKAADAAVASARREADETRRALAAEQRSLEEELANLAGARKGEIAGLDAALLARYEQLVKQRRGVAVASMTGETCNACFVRLRPHVTQQIRRNDSIFECESCSRILYFEPPVEGG
jgi:predicted  nucleic acid-binding Zn-ribbon protein